MFLKRAVFELCLTLLYVNKRLINNICILYEYLVLFICHQYSINFTELTEILEKIDSKKCHSKS